MDTQSLPIVTFGKYKGKPVIELSNNAKYLEYCNKHRFKIKRPALQDGPFYFSNATGKLNKKYMRGVDYFASGAYNEANCSFVPLLLLLASHFSHFT